jgi:hypothetical protein
MTWPIHKSLDGSLATSFLPFRVLTVKQESVCRFESTTHRVIFWISHVISLKRLNSLACCGVASPNCVAYQRVDASYCGKRINAPQWNGLRRVSFMSRYERMQCFVWQNMKNVAQCTHSRTHARSPQRSHNTAAQKLCSLSVSCVYPRIAGSQPGFVPESVCKRPTDRPMSPRELSPPHAVKPFISVSSPSYQRRRRRRRRRHTRGLSLRPTPPHSWTWRASVKRIQSGHRQRMRAGRPSGFPAFVGGDVGVDWAIIELSSRCAHGRSTDIDASYACVRVPARSSLGLNVRPSYERRRRRIKPRSSSSSQKHRHLSCDGTRASAACRMHADSVRSVIGGCNLVATRVHGLWHVRCGWSATWRRHWCDVMCSSHCASRWPACIDGILPGHDIDLRRDLYAFIVVVTYIVYWFFPSYLSVN